MTVAVVDGDGVGMRAVAQPAEALERKRRQRRAVARRPAVGQHVLIDVVGLRADRDLGHVDRLIGAEIDRRRPVRIERLVQEEDAVGRVEIERAVAVQIRRRQRRRRVAVAPIEQVHLVADREAVGRAERAAAHAGQNRQRVPRLLRRPAVVVENRREVRGRDVHHAVAREVADDRAVGAGRHGPHRGRGERAVAAAVEDVHEAGGVHQSHDGVAAVCGGRDQVDLAVAGDVGRRDAGCTPIDRDVARRKREGALIQEY